LVVQYWELNTCHKNRRQGHVQTTSFNRLFSLQVRVIITNQKAIGGEPPVFRILGHNATEPARNGDEGGKSTGSS
jgi:hypothetical protein